MAATSESQQARAACSACHDFTAAELRACGASNANSYRYLKWSASGRSGARNCLAMEVEFVGNIFAFNDGAACPVTVQTHTAPYRSFTGAVVSPIAVSDATIRVSAPATPSVTSITPRIGSALGGEVVTINGSGFGPGIASVSLNGMPCAVTGTPTNTSLQCTSGVRTEIMPVSVEVNITGVGLALVNSSTTTYFSYLDKWSSTSTWLYDEPPGPGDSVIVPKGQAILVDVSPPELVLVLVQGELRFDQTQPEMTFDASYIFILGGKFEVGTEANPYLNKLTVTLHGDRLRSVEIPGAGAKCLAVMNSMESMARAAGMNVYAGPDRSDAGAMLQVQQIEEGENRVYVSVEFDFLLQVLSLVRVLGPLVGVLVDLAELPIVFNVACELERVDPRLAVLDRLERAHDRERELWPERGKGLAPARRVLAPLAHFQHNFRKNPK